MLATHDLQPQAAALLEAYQEATNSLAHQVKRQVELIEVIGLIG